MVIDLPAGTYDLTTGQPLTFTSAAGISIAGAGETSTVIDGGGATGVISEEATSSTAPSPILFLSSLSVEHGSASDGGGIYASSYSGNGGSLSLHQVAVADNSGGSGDGGGIYADSVNVYLTDSSVTGNSASAGGGIYAYDAVLEAAKSFIDSNTTPAGSDGNGAGMYVDESVVIMTGGSLRQNVAGDATGGYGGYGGALYDSEDSVFDLTDVTVNGNKAVGGGDGGAIYSDYGYSTFHITGGSLSYNSSEGTDNSGGGIYTQYGGVFVLKDVTMSHDQSTGTASGGYGGGTIYDYSGYGDPNEITIENSTISESNNASVYIYGYANATTLNLSKTTFYRDSDASENSYAEDGNSSPMGCGGAVCVYDEEYFSLSANLTGDKFLQNSASAYDAAGAFQDTQTYYDGSTITMTGDEFAGNVSTGEYGSGAVLAENYYDSPIALSISDSTFSSNRATDAGYGGAVDAYAYDEYDPLTVDLSGDTFAKNSVGNSAAEGWGGAMYIGYYASLTDHGSKFAENTAYGPSSGGGALYDDGYDSEQLSGTSFVGNRAVGDGSYGGAVFNESEGGVLYNGVTMTSNSSEEGGGLYDEGYGTEIQNSTFSRNVARADSSAPGYGGAIYDEGAPLRLVNSTLSGNTAHAFTATSSSSTSSPGYGGAIYSYSYNPIAIDYSTLSGNSTANVTGNTAATGAGIYSYDGSGAILGSIIAGNTTVLSGKATESDCGASATEYQLSSVGHNVFGDATCAAPGGLQATDVVTSSPGLSGLGKHGGPTATMALEPSSPAIGNGGTATCPTTDERGVARPAGMSCDSGAYELAQGLYAVSPTGAVRGAGGAYSLGSIKAPGGPVAAIASVPAHNGYWVLSQSGSVHEMGNAHFYGSLVSHKVKAGPGRYAVAIVSTPDAKGYWIATEDGRIRAFGDATKFTWMNKVLGAGHYATAMAVTSNGKGAWLLTENGSVFHFGTAKGEGSLPATMHLNLTSGHHAVAIVPTMDDRGYWVATENGRIYNFGDAHFYGSFFSKKIKLGTAKVVGLVPTPDHLGYLAVTSTGKVYAFGDAHRERLALRDVAAVTAL